MIKLEPEQIRAVNALRNGNILCGGVGSGKSLTSLAYYIRNALDCKLYIITTARKRDTFEWEEECHKMDLDISDIVVDSWNNIGKYENIRNAFFIFDEQRVVGSGAWVKSFLKICKFGNQWLLLSATPGDTWMDYIPVFIANGFYRNRTHFITQHVIFNRFSKFPQVQTYIDVDTLLKYKHDITIYMDTPKRAKKIIKDFIVTYNKVGYFKIVKSRKNPETGEPIKNASEHCSCLRKVSNTAPDRLTTIKYCYDLHKKIIVFYNFDYELELLKEFCAENGITYAEWNGHSHDYIPETDEWIYLVQYTAGCEGWNCIKTNCIVFYSASYSYKAMAQAAGRIDRLNTPFKELYYYYIWTDSRIDKAIRQTLLDKKSFNEKLWLKKEEEEN